MKNSIRNSTVLLFIFICYLSVSAQNQKISSPEPELPTPRWVYRKDLDANNYLAPIVELKAREAEYLAAPQLRESYLETMTQLYAFVGDYCEAYAFEETFLGDLEPRIKFRAANAKDITVSPLENFKAISAFEAIKNAADKHRVIIINEEHRVPAHRALTHRLLAALYAKGFRYFAAETLSEFDTDLNRRGYPVQKTGYYTADPVYGDVVRQALKLGFKVIPYEFEKKCAKPEDFISCNNEREVGQAQNLYDRILKDDPGAKFFIHVGRGHASKQPEHRGLAFMARRFWEITGIEPFTVDQETYTERKNPIDERPLYRFLMDKNLLLKEPTVFRSADGEDFRDLEGYDLRVFTPRARYANGRADWLKLGGARKAQTLNLKKLKFPAKNNVFNGNAPVLVQAFVAGEGADAIPIDQIILYPNKEIAVLMLPAGNFNVRAIGETGKIAGMHKLTVRFIPASSAASRTFFLPAPSGKIQAEYKLTILPVSRNLFVEATIRGAEKSEIKSWVAGIGGLNAQILSSNAGEIKFAYTVAVPEKERLNSPDAYLDKNRFRMWGWNVFIFPLLDKPSGEVALTIDAPEEWSGRATSFGVNQKRFVLPNLNALLDMAVAAGDYRTSEFTAAGVPVYLAVRKEHAVSDEVFKETLKRLIEAGARYTGAKLPERVFFAVDLLGERKTYAPGNHVRGGAHGSTIMIDRDNADPRQPQFWGTYSHEFTHTWIPAVFGNSALTQKELGSFFTEGFTDYLAYRITHSAGIHTDEQFARALSKFYLEYLDVAGSVENEQDAEFLRYRQGMMAAWILDIELLRRSKGKYGFRELIRLLVRKYENSDGLTKQKLITTLAELGGAEIAAFYENLTNPEKKIDFSGLLKDSGIKIQFVQNAREALKSYSAGSAPPVSFNPATERQKMFLRWFLSREN